MTTEKTIEEIFESARNVENVEKQHSLQQLIERAEMFSTETSSADIRQIFTDAAPQDELDVADLVRIVAKKTKKPASLLRKIARQQAHRRPTSSQDTGERLKNIVLQNHFAGGAHLVRTPQGQFWSYTGTHWQRKSDEQISNIIHDTINLHGDPDDGAFSGQLAQTLSLLRAHCTTQHDPFGFTEDPLPVVNCLNGELHIDPDTGRIKHQPHTASHMLTFCLPFDYQPFAHCPEYDRALEQIFSLAHDPAEVIRHWHEFVGYAIQPCRDIPAFFMLKGFGANGKSKLIETIIRLTGQDACASMRVETLADRFARSALLGKIIMVDDDVDAGTKLPDGILKSLSERKQLSIEFKGQTPFEAVLNTLPILLCNNYPSSSDVTYGMVRRAYIIPFQRQFQPHEQDATLFPRIWATEMPGVLNRALEGLQRVRQRRRFDPPADCERAKDHWMNAANPLKAFIAECTTEHANHTLKVNDLYQAFSQWAHDSGLHRITARNTMKRNLEAMGFSMSISGGYPTVQNHALNSTGLHALEKARRREMW